MIVYIFWVSLWLY